MIAGCAQVSPTQPVPQANGIVATEPKLGGADVAYLINQRYRATPSKCFVDKPVYECSGLLLRTVPTGSAGTSFWQLTNDEVTSGVARLSYARADLPPVHPPYPVGFVLADRPTAVGNGQPYELKCGCPPIGGGMPDCAPCPGDPIAVGVSAWDVAAPAKLAVQAVYYDVANIDALGVSFSYARADMLMTRLISGRGDAGMIVREFAAPVQRPLTFRCVYPRDAGTGVPDRCLSAKHPTCASVGVTTPQAWVALFNSGRLCSFDPSAQSVDTSTRTRAAIVESNRFWNEAIIGVWPQNVPEEIPFDAIFYVGDGLGGAQFVQRDYLQTTGRFMPVLHVDLTQTPGARAFTYNPTEQSFTLNGALDAPPPPDTKWQPGPR
ncbi:hypothetical protein ACPWR0_17825 [Pandoraea pneumonica]|uniref:hypothetical protein n=1 Tax=Pandoraea pneumonica TaxID=2508299 RepID=UPI003CFA4D8F